MFIIGGISTPSGKRFDIATKRYSQAEFTIDMPLNFELYQKLNYNSLRKQLEEKSYFKSKQEDEKKLICDFILKNIDNINSPNVLVEIDVDVASKIKGSTYSRLSEETMYYKGLNKFSTYNSHLTSGPWYDVNEMYIKFNFNNEARFFYIYEGTGYRILRKMINPIDDYVIKLDIEGMWDGYENDLEKFYLKY